MQDRTVWSPGGTWLRGRRRGGSTVPAWALSAECRKAVGAGSISRQGGRHGRGILRLLPFARQRIVRTGEGSPNLYSPSAGTGEYEPRLGLFPGKTFHKGYFGLAGKRAYGQFHDAVVGFHLADTVRLAEFGCREYFGSRSASLQRLPGKQYRSCWRKVDTGWVLVSVLIFCRKVSKSVVLSVRFPSFSLSWVIFISIFCFVTCRQNDLLTVY